MQLPIEQGKGKEGRYTLLSLVTLNLLTNLISITDGQIYLSPQLFQGGLLPAV